MDREDAKNLLLNQEPFFLQEAKTKVNGHKSYICPCCQNGSGKSGTGIALDTSNTQKRSYKCFKCGLYEDVIGLWKLSRGIADDRQAFEELYEYYNIQIETGGSSYSNVSYQFLNEAQQQQPQPQKIDIRQYPDEPVQDYSQYYAECQSRLKNTSYLTGRGISEATAIKCGVGYDPHWKHPKSTYNYTNEVIIIPTSKTSYVARHLKPYIDKNGDLVKVKKVGTVELFNSSALYNTDKPVFIVEGEIDALSVIEAGGQAVGLGSTNNKNKLITLIKNQRPAQPLIVALDSDDAGRKAQKELIKELELLEVQFVDLDVNQFCAGQKDPNDALTADREGFFERCRKVYSDVPYWLHERYFQMCGHGQKDQQNFIDALRNSGNTPALSTGFKKLDELLDGGLYEGLYIVGAISSLGKTTFCLQMADQIAVSGSDVLIISLEMSRFELYSKSISRLTAVECVQNSLGISKAKSTRDISDYSRFAKYSNAEQVLIKDSISGYFADVYPHIYVYEAQTGGDDVTVPKIRSLVSQHIEATGNKPVVIVDYLQIIAPIDAKATDKQITDQNVKELKRISRDFKTPVIAISSFNRENYNTRVSMQAFKESGAIEYSSDVLIGLQLYGTGLQGFNVDVAKGNNPREIELKILKNRNGRTGATFYKYYSVFNLFTEADEKELTPIATATKKEK